MAAFMPPKADLSLALPLAPAVAGGGSAAVLLTLATGAAGVAGVGLLTAGGAALATCCGEYMFGGMVCRLSRAFLLAALAVRRATGELTVSASSFFSSTIFIFICQVLDG